MTLYLQATATTLPKREIKLKYTRPKLYPKQLEAMFYPKDCDGNPARGSVIEATTKAGKTISAVLWLIEKSFESGRDSSGKPKNYWWLAPTYVQAKIAFKRMKAGLPRSLYRSTNNPLEISFPNGAVVSFRSGDRPDDLYGEEVWALVVDEASRIKPDAWAAAYSTMTATEGPIRLIGNVRGRKNWNYMLARRAEKGWKGWSYHKITWRDAVAAGVINLSAIEDAKSAMSAAVFAQNYEAIASDDGSNPFGLEYIRACCVKHMSTKPTKAWGIDLGKSRDWTVCIGLDELGAVTEYHRWQKVPWGDTIARIKKLVGRRPALVDATKGSVGDPILEDLQKEAGSNFYPFQFTNQTKQILMEGLAKAIQEKAVSYPYDDRKAPPFMPTDPNVLVIELESFEYSNSGRYEYYSAPEGEHDDTVCALALAVMCLKNYGTTSADLWNLLLAKKPR